MVSSSLEKKLCCVVFKLGHKTTVFETSAGKDELKVKLVKKMSEAVLTSISFFTHHQNLCLCLNKSSGGKKKKNKLDFRISER